MFWVNLNGLLQQMSIYKIIWIRLKPNNGLQWPALIQRKGNYNKNEGTRQEFVDSRRVNEDWHLVKQVARHLFGMEAPFWQILSTFAKLPYKGDLWRCTVQALKLAIIFAVAQYGDNLCRGKMGWMKFWRLEWPMHHAEKCGHLKLLRKTIRRVRRNVNKAQCSADVALPTATIRRP